MATITASASHTGFGLLGFTWRPDIVPDARAFPAMKAAIDNGATVWSTASAYGMAPEPPTAGIRLIRRFFDAHPELAPKVTLFIRGCFDSANFTCACSAADVRASWQECADILGDAKSIDVFGPARIDAAVPVEETLGALKALLAEGKIGAVGLSEVRAETMRRAAAVCPIAYAEVDFSLWNDEMLHNGVAAAARECGVTVLAYSPLGRGFLTGQIKSLDDVPEGDLRRRMGRFQPEAFQHNLALVERVQRFAATKGCTPAQVALAWVRAHSNQGVCGNVVPIPGATAASRVEENCQEVTLSGPEKQELDGILAAFEVKGHRAIPGNDHLILT